MNIHNLNEIEALAHIMEQTGLTGLQLTQGDCALRLEREYSPHGGESRPASPPLARRRETPPQPEDLGGLGAPQPPDAGGEMAGENRAVPLGREICSPMVGVFYAAPAPDAQPFVAVGSRVKEGDVLCIIEAMKLMNEITAEAAGEIVEVCVPNGQVVEFGQPLFRIV